MTPRHPQWEQRLHDLLAANADRPYAYSQWDCLLMPAAVVKAVIGKDFARGHRGKYRSPASASRYLRSIGFDHPEQMIDSLFDEKPIGFAALGDLVLCRTPTGDNPGVCIGGDALVVGQQGDKEGLLRVPRKDWLKAWTIGEHHSGPVEIKRPAK